VLAVDLRGFGDSETPADVNSVEAWDSTEDISAALTFLESLDRVDSEQLFIVGHSLGGTWAIKASEKEQRIKRVAVIGPGKRQRVSTERSREEFRERFWKVRNLEQPIEMGTFEKIPETTFLAAVLDYFKGEHHQPILLIDGELESKASKTYLEEQYEQMTDPKSFVRLEGSAHYLSVAGLEELHRLPGVGNLAVYDRRTMTVALAAIDNFLSE
jgi:pimeloyl-ACP methyl ester carboxylesterase